MNISDMANADCEECGGEGYCDYARGEDSEELPCQVCFKPEKGKLQTSWEDLRDDEDRDDGF